MTRVLTVVGWRSESPAGEGGILAVVNECGKGRDCERAVDPSVPAILGSHGQADEEQ